MRHPYRISLSAVAIVAVAVGWLGSDPLRTDPGLGNATDAISLDASRPRGPLTRPVRTPQESANRRSTPLARPPARSGNARTEVGATIAAAPAERSVESADPSETVRGIAPLHLLSAARNGTGAMQHADGLDLAGPRELTLWRIDFETGRAAVVAATRSSADGRFGFERLLLPDAGATLVVTPRGGYPHGPAASEPLESNPRIPPPPPAWVVGQNDEGLRIRVVAGPGATVWASPAARIEPRRVVLSTDRRVRGGPTHRAHQSEPGGIVRLPELEDGEGWIVSQSLPDGRQSEWRPIAQRDQTETRHQGDGT